MTQNLDEAKAKILDMEHKLNEAKLAKEAKDQGSAQELRAELEQKVKQIAALKEQNYLIEQRCQIELSSSSETSKSLQMELRESRAQAAIARKEKNAAATKAAELKQALASVTKQNKLFRQQLSSLPLAPPLAPDDPLPVLYDAVFVENLLAGTTKLNDSK